METSKRVFYILLGVLLMMGMSACSSTQTTEDEPSTTSPTEDEGTTADTQQTTEPIQFALPDWPGATVKTAVVEQILEEQGYAVEVNQLEPGIIYSQLGSGELDVLLAGWLPVTHESYWSKEGDTLEKVNVNVNETWLGLAVPTYTYEKGVTSLEDLKDNTEMFNGNIVGIGSGAGVMQSTEQAMKNYSFENYNLQASSTAAMMAEVDSAISEQEDVVFTIWEPHSAFAKFDIRKLSDPKGIYGGGDVVYTIARDDFVDDYPEAYRFLQNFEVSPDTQSKWILEYSNKGKEPEVVAENWIANNTEKVEQWWNS